MNHLKEWLSMRSNLLKNSECTRNGYVVTPKCMRTEQEIIDLWNEPSDVKVSIYCMTFNHADYVHEALEGMLIQETNFAYEILIHDDASTDGTREIIESYVERFPRLIKPIYQVENQYSKGVKVANLNIERVKGKYIAQCEGDDFWFNPVKLQMQYDFMENNPEISVSGHSVMNIESDGRVIDSCSPCIDYDLDISKEQMVYGFNLPSKSMMWRSSIPHPADPMPRGDTFRLAYYSNFGKAYCFKTVMGVYRCHSGGIWSGLSEIDKCYAHLGLYKSMIKYLPKDLKGISYLRLLVFLVRSRRVLKLKSISLLPKVVSLLLINMNFQLIRFMVSKND